MKKMLALVAILLGTQSAMAWSTSDGTTKIDRMFTYGDFAVAALHNSAGNAESCGNTTGNFVAFPIVDAGGKALYSAALTAFTTGTKIRFGQHGCVDWSGGVAKVYRIELIK